MSAFADVPPAYKNIAAEYSHPPELLFSVALAESGHHYGNVFLPWPWAVNHAGGSYFFDTREEAYEYCASLLDRGDTNFDVSIMQVSWRWFSDRFTSLWDAFDPYQNIRVGAAILREHYEETGSYETAVGYYHSRKKKNSTRYRDRVSRILGQFNMNMGDL